MVGPREAGGTVVGRALGGLERRILGIKLKVKARFGLFRPLEILIYRSHGTPDRLRVVGRVVEESETRALRADASLLRNVLDTIRRMESDELPNARLRIRAGGSELECTTDHEGFFAVELPCAESLAPGWHRVEAWLLDSPAGQSGLVGSGEVLVPAKDCEFGVISDLDDTVIRTGARRRLTHTRLLLSRNALTHVPFPGVAEFYRLLLRGADGRGANPVFYVSRSAWALYDLFIDFMDRHGLPKGAVDLMDAALVEDKSPAVGARDHKPDTIERILQTHPGLSFVLIGDSGQGDAENYLGVARRWPSRIRAVYIRDVTDGERDDEVAHLVRQIEATGVPALSSGDTAEMARHAERLGLIAEGGAERVESARRESARADGDGAGVQAAPS